MTKLSYSDGCLILVQVNKVWTCVALPQELALLEYSCLEYAPSLVAVCAILLAQLHDGANNHVVAAEKLMHLAPPCAPELREACLAELLELMQRVHNITDLRNPFAHIKEKYATNAWHKVSLVQPIQGIMYAPPPRLCSVRVAQLVSSPC